MKIESKILIAALNNVKPIVERRTTLPILSCVKLHTERNRLHITATNLDEFIVDKVEVEGELDPTCVSFNYLSMAISGELTEIKIVKNAIQVMCGEDETIIATQDATEFPALPEFKNPENHGAACSELSKSVNQVYWAASDDPSRYILQSVFISSSAKKLSVVSTNGRELALVEDSLIGSSFEILVPIGFVSNFCKALDRAGATLSSTKSQIKVGHDWGVYFCKQLDGNYTNYKQAIPTDVKPLGTVSVDEFRGVIASCTGFSTHGEAKGVFKFSKKEMAIEFIGDNNSKLSRHMAGSFAVLTIALSTKKMLKVFQNIKTDEANLFYTDELSAITIEAGDLKVVTMPMRIG